MLYSPISVRHLNSCPNTGWGAFVALILLFWLLPLRGNSKAPAPVLPPDYKTAVQLRQPAPGRLQAYRAQREFRYTTEENPQNLSGYFLARFLRFLSRLLQTRSGSFVWGYGVKAVLAAALLFALLKVLQVDLTRAFGRAPYKAAFQYEHHQENIHGLDFPALLTAAEADRNYRLAVRLGYLFVLKQLSDQAFIKWQPEKTNRHYLEELKGTPLQEAFAALTQQFEYAWYGEQNLTAEQYALVRSGRTQFLNQVSLLRAA